MSIIEIRKTSITDLDTDVIVNAANEDLAPGGGVCGAIFKAAGFSQLQDACEQIGHCSTGYAVITPGFHLSAKYIIHAVGPRWKDGKHKEPDLLYGAYSRALQLAADNGCSSIGFPLISAGIYGYPIPKAWAVALNACTDFLDTHPGRALHIVFAILSGETMQIGHKLLVEGKSSKYRIAERSDWNISGMPTRHDTFTLKNHFTPAQMMALRRGNIPKEMEDKWFWFMEGNTLYAHRSWTGFCIYRVDFKPDDAHVVTVNRDLEQYKCTSVEEDKKTLFKLLGWWTQDHYDYYHEWLSETYDTLVKTGQIKETLSISGMTMDAVFFHKPDESYGFLSNWYPSPFEIDGMKFSCAEQYLMYRKCIIFGDEETAQKVMKTDDPASQQAIGRKAKGYVHNVWAGMRQMVAFKALLAKFSQNKDLRQKLLDTGDAFLVECAASDKVWACGLRLNDEKRFDTANWTGQNILGFTLMQVRDLLRASTD